MTKAAAPQKDDATARQTVGQILKQVAHVVGYLTLALGIGAVVASCAASVKTHALDCTPKPLPKECRDAL